MFCTYFLSFSSTLWFYHQKRISQEESYQITFTQLELSSAQADIDNKVEIVKYSSYNKSSFGNLNDPLLWSFIFFFNIEKCVFPMIILMFRENYKINASLSSSLKIQLLPSNNMLYY